TAVSTRAHKPTTAARERRGGLTTGESSTNSANRTLPPVVRHRRTILTVKPRSQHSPHIARAASVKGMAEDPDVPNEDEFRELMREFVAGNSDIDPAALARAAGLGSDPALIQQLIGQFQSALQNSTGEINWDTAREHATAYAERTRTPSLPQERDALTNALHVAALWLDEATSIAPLTTKPRLLSRTEWVTETLPVWTQLAEPVAGSIADALTAVL